MVVNLSLSVDKVRMLAQKARAMVEAVDDSYEDGHEGDVEFDADTLSDAHAHDGLVEEEADDPSENELRQLIDDLNVDEAAELVAIAWLGRGDFDVTDFDQAVSQARERSRNSTSNYLLGMPMLADFLEAGLDAFVE